MRAMAARVMAPLLFFSDSLSLGGAEEVLVNLVLQADRMRWQPRVAVPRYPAMRPVVARLRGAGVDVDEFPPSDGLPWPRRIRAFRSYLRRVRPALVYVNRPRLPDRSTAVVLAARLAGLPIVLHDHWTVPRDWAERDGAVRTGRDGASRRRALSGVRNLFTYRLPVAAARWIIFPAEATRRISITQFRYPRARTRVVPNGIDVDGVARAAADRTGARRALGLDPGVPVVLCAARLAREKGHHFLLHAIAEVARTIPGMQLLLAGDGSLRPELEAIAATLALGDRVAFLGWRDDVPRLMAACDLLVLPSLSECLPLVCLEAMAAGRPVVASAVGGIPEVVVEGVTGRLVAPGDTGGLAAAITDLLRDPDLARAMGQAGRARVAERFSLARMRDEIYALLER